MIQNQQQRWKELTDLLDWADRGGVRDLEVSDVRRLCRLYRQVTIDLSRARTLGEDPDVVRYLNLLAARAHGQVYAARPIEMRPLLTFVLTGFPRLVRRHAVPLLISGGIFLLATLASFIAVARQPELAYTLFDERVVEYENIRLEKQQGEYKGNFTFSVAASPFVAVLIIVNNVRVALVMFALGALFCVPCIFLLVYNGRMLGTLTGLVWAHGYFLDFYALILTHGMLELTAICISGGAGMILGWSLIAPGQLPRKEALRRAALDAFGLLGGAALMLVAAGIIEAHVTPHFSQPVRWSVAGLSALALVLYFGLAGRERKPTSPSPIGGEGEGARTQGTPRTQG
jgi:uncharacterized membrane protein SpoIIM required for sporulation